MANGFNLKWNVSNLFGVYSKHVIIHPTPKTGSYLTTSTFLHLSLVDADYIIYNFD